ncbi:low affinity iron permease family protein [Chitinophaga sp. GCM10012297]|uniref:Low affinity iron permease family protein n=1 Tax=Chitinophaga chungangae TaxID=2821488 RepID=A0ABS3YEZ3_9BACT|nr:low affinity iron permease family protein [Chitinophaga chungangae]MBO9153025.1 low affinity iron permease family protein [Chitinophaga chungangae]
MENKPPVPAGNGKGNGKAPFFERFATKVVNATGNPWAFIIAFAVILVWAITGPLFGFSDTWQLVINTGTTIVTFLMVFIIQKSQNKDSKSIQLKLNELIAATKTASNRLIDVESMSEEELNTLHSFYTKLASEMKKNLDLKRSHSIEEAMENTESKLKGRR